jgi:hypothetical protein
LTGRCRCRERHLIVVARGHGHDARTEIGRESAIASLNARFAVRRSVGAVPRRLFSFLRQHYSFIAPRNGTISSLAASLFNEAGDTE